MRAAADIFCRSDLSGKTEFSPAVRLKIGPNNQAKILRVLLLDNQERSATWDFSLDGVPTGQMQLLTPHEGATVGVPNNIGKPGQIARFEQNRQPAIAGQLGW